VYSVHVENLFFGRLRGKPLPAFFDAAGPVMLIGLSAVMRRAARMSNSSACRFCFRPKHRDRLAYKAGRGLPFGKSDHRRSRHILLEFLGSKADPTLIERALPQTGA
jgi:hypothetical protein